MWYGPTLIMISKGQYHFLQKGKGQVCIEHETGSIEIEWFSESIESLVTHQTA